MRRDEQNKISLAYVLKEFNKNYLNQISNFQQLKNPFMLLFPFFFSILSHQYSFSYLSGPSHSLSHNFFVGPVSSSAQPRIQPTNPISFGHL
jgi:hypothetical protein